MKRKRLIVIDSGTGGLHILKECTRILPECEYIYIADTCNSPYGNKSRRKLQKITLPLFQYLENKYHPDGFVIACNTLTTCCIDTLRKVIKTPIIGTEPALKQAKTHGGKTIFFATKTTINNFAILNSKIENMLHYRNIHFEKNQKILKINIKNLATLLDYHNQNEKEIRSLIENEFSKKKYKQTKNIVIGCTHYIAVEQQMKEIFGKEVRIFDGAKAVAKQVEYIIKNHSHPSLLEQNFSTIKSQDLHRTKITFLTSTASTGRAKELEAYFNNIN